MFLMLFVLNVAAWAVWPMWLTVQSGGGYRLLDDATFATPANPNGPMAYRIGAWGFATLVAFLGMSLMGLLGLPIALAVAASFPGVYLLRGKNIESFDENQRVVAEMKAKRAEIVAEKYSDALEAHGPVIALGTSRGVLDARFSAGGVPEGNPVRIGADQLARGVYVVGPPGSGKTRVIMQPAAHKWLLADSTAGLITYCIKGAWTRDMIRICLESGRTADQIHVYGPGPGRRHGNLIAGLSPEAVGSAIAGFSAAEKSAGADVFFFNSVRDYVRAAYGIFENVNTKTEPPWEAELVDASGTVTKFVPRYDFASLGFIIDLAPNVWFALSKAVKERAEDLNRRGLRDASRALVNGAVYLDGFYGPATDAKTRANILSSVKSAAKVLLDAPGPFARAFVEAREPFDLAWLEDGGVILLDVDLDVYPESGKLAYALIQRQIELLSGRRNRTRETAAGKPLNWICALMDEARNYITPDTLTTAEKCRQAQIALVIGVQTQATVITRMGQDNATALAGSMGTVVLFPNAPAESRALIDAGKVMVRRQSGGTSVGDGTSRGLMIGSFEELAGSVSTNRGANNGWSESDEDALTPQVYQSMRRNFNRTMPWSDQWSDIVIRTTLPIQDSETEIYERESVEILRADVYDASDARNSSTPTEAPANSPLALVLAEGGSGYVPPMDTEIPQRMLDADPLAGDREISDVYYGES